MTFLLGIDIGTSSAKAVLFNCATQQVAAVAGREYPLHKPAPDRAEQNPDDWWQAVAAVVRQTLDETGRPPVAAIGLSGQMHGTLLLNSRGRPLHPAIIWADQRSAAACKWLVDAVGTERYTALTGTMPAPGFMGPTLLWLARHSPGLLARARHAILPKDYVRFCLTGRIATDVSDAAGTGLFNITRRVWAAEILDAAHLPQTILPPVLASSAVAAELAPQAAGALGLPPGIPVVAGCADQPAQAIGNGLVAPGLASVTTGSGGQVFVPVRPQANSGSPSLKTDPRLHIFNHAVPDTWYVLGAILSAGLSLRWLRNLTGLEHTPDAYAILSAEAEAVPPGANGLLFLPYLSGERTPHMDPLARGGFIGLTHYHHRGHLARAVMEGVAFALRQALALSLEAGGQAEKIIVAGGGATSPVWRRIQADVFGLPLQPSRTPEQAGVGAALLAGVGAGIYPNLAEACRQTVRYGPAIRPNPAAQARYNQLYSRFTGLYPRLQNDFHHLAGY